MKMTNCLVALICTVVVLAIRAATASDLTTADVLVQAGHEGRPDCNLEIANLCHNTGSPGEIQWTPVVANEITRVLRKSNIAVLRKSAYLQGPYNVKDAVFIHFDGATQPCASGASVGYPLSADSKVAAAKWKASYSKYFPFKFEADNFTGNLSGYYGYAHVHASDAAIVLEGGEISCPAQRAWLSTHLIWYGDLIAYFLSERLGIHTVPPPTFRR